MTATMISSNDDMFSRGAGVETRNGAATTAAMALVQAGEINHGNSSSCSTRGKRTSAGVVAAERCMRNSDISVSSVQRLSKRPRLLRRSWRGQEAEEEGIRSATVNSERDGDRFGGVANDNGVEDPCRERHDEESDENHGNDSDGEQLQTQRFKSSQEDSRSSPCLSLAFEVILPNDIDDVDADQLQLSQEEEKGKEDESARDNELPAVCMLNIATAKGLPEANTTTKNGDRSVAATSAALNLDRFLKSKAKTMSDYSCPICLEVFCEDDGILPVTLDCCSNSLCQGCCVLMVELSIYIKRLIVCEYQ
jgi:hypothetical protein